MRLRPHCYVSISELLHFVLTAMRFVRLLLFRTVHDVALMIDRERAGREASPTAGVIDSQTVKAPMAETRGYDAGQAGQER